MSWYSIFYWLTVAESVKMITGILSIVFGIYCIFAYAAALGIFVDGNDDKSFTYWEKGSKRVFYIFNIFFYISIIMWAFLPNKKSSLMIIAGGGTLEFLSSDSSAKKIPSEVTNFLVTELRSMAKDAEVDLGIADQKEKILEKAKSMTAEEIIKQIKIDSNFRKLLLE